MSEKLILKLDTGDVTIETLPDNAPKHVARIQELADDGFYDGLTFHRVIEGFMAQGGCPRGDGTGGSGQNLDAEFNDTSHQRGICSMARAQTPIALIASFSFVWTTRHFWIINIRFGAGCLKAWKTWTPPIAASRQEAQPKSSHSGRCRSIRAFKNRELFTSIWRSARC